MNKNKCKPMKKKKTPPAEDDDSDDESKAVDKNYMHKKSVHLFANCLDWQRSIR
jgi:hypothetical protein